MRKITSNLMDSFLAGQPKKDGNTYTDGKALFLHNHKIAEHRADGVYVTLSSYGYSRTTADRLSPLCSITTKQGTVFLNGERWTGEWKLVQNG